MAEVKSTILSGSILLPTTENTSSAGNIWFDGTDVKYSTLGPGAWSAGGTMITARFSVTGTAQGSSEAGLVFSGRVPGTVGCTEEYNGSSWATGGVLNEANHGKGGAGTQNAGLGWGGGPTGNMNCTEEYNGTSWSLGNALINGMSSSTGLGTQNAAISALGYNNPPANTRRTCTEEYNGTSWSAGGALSVQRFNASGGGTQNASIVFGGQDTAGGCTNTEEYNGSSWSNGGALITGTHSSGGSGTQNAAARFGGNPTLTCTEEYNGTSWSVGSSMICGRGYFASNGCVYTNSLAAGGLTPSILSCTEEFTQPITACTL